MSPELWGRVRYQPRRPSVAHTVVIVRDPCQLSGQFEHLTKSCGHWLGSMSFCRVPPAWLSCFKPLSVWQYQCMDEPSLGRAGRGSKESWRIPGRGAQASLREARERNHVLPPPGAGCKPAALPLQSCCSSVLQEVFRVARYHRYLQGKFFR